MAITTFAANKLLDYNFGSSSYSLPSTYWVGLSTADPTVAGLFTNEPSGNGYARVEFTNNKTNWGSAALSILLNAAEISFPQSSGSWGTITYVFLASASTAGDMWYYSQVSPSRSVPTLTTVKFVVGAISISMVNT